MSKGGFAMIKKYLAHTCIIAVISLLAVVFCMWMKPLNSVGHQKSSKEEKICSHVPTSSTVFLAEVKPRISGFEGKANTAGFIFAPYVQVGQSETRLRDSHATALVRTAPIWLLHRSLLI